MVRRPIDLRLLSELQQQAERIANSIEQVEDPQYAAYSQGVAETLAWLVGGDPTPALIDLLELEGE